MALELAQLVGSNGLVPMQDLDVETTTDLRQVADVVLVVVGDEQAVNGRDTTLAKEFRRTNRELVSRLQEFFRTILPSVTSW